MVLRLSILAAVSFSAIGLALAQVEDVEPAPGEITPDDEVSELDALSRTTDDVFSEFEEAQLRKPVSVKVRALDKITARYTDIEAPIGEVAKFGSLEILPRYCDKRPPEEFPETTAFLEVFDRDLARARAGASVEARAIDGLKDVARSEPAAPPPADESSASREAFVDQLSAEAASAKPVDPDRIFSGWMFASSPSLNALEHPIYDVWVIDCKTVVVDN